MSVSQVELQFETWFDLTRDIFKIALLNFLSGWLSSLKIYTQLIWISVAKAVKPIWFSEYQIAKSIKLTWSGYYQI